MNSTTYDAIIVGSGAGGAAAAYRLGVGGHRVLILEKGRALPRDGSTLDIKRVVHDGEFLSKEPWVDGKGGALRPEEHFNVGGKTKWYGAAVLRFAPEEFAAESAHGCRAWPISFQDLEPYYQQAERMLGVRQFECEPNLQKILRGLEQYDSDWVSQPLPLALHREISLYPDEAAHFDGFASVADLKGDAELSWLAKVSDLPNVTLETGAEVVALLPASDASESVAGVRLADGREYRGNRVLLAAGALHSPRLLQRYLADSGLAGTLPAAAHVGRNLKLHLLTAMVAVSPSVKGDLLRKTMLTVNEAYPHSSVQALGFDGELIETLIPKFVPRFIAKLVGRRSYGFFLQTEDGSHPDNRVYEKSDADRTRVLDYDAARVAAAAQEHRNFTSGLRRALFAQGFASFIQRIGLNGTAHACGTLIAGNDPQSSVVDRDGRVHGMRGLYVVDGSVMSRSSRVNPSLTIFAWGLRVADRIAMSPVAARVEPTTTLKLAAATP